MSAARNSRALAGVVRPMNALAAPASRHLHAKRRFLDNAMAGAPPRPPDRSSPIIGGASPRCHHRSGGERGVGSLGPGLGNPPSVTRGGPMVQCIALFRTTVTERLPLRSISLQEGPIVSSPPRRRNNSGSEETIL